jgi:putative GTP pyrophosphokinase
MNLTELGGFPLNALDGQVMSEDIERLRRHAAQFQERQHLYKSAIREITTKLEILDDDFKVRHQYNPIHNISSRIKKPDSIMKKAMSKGYTSLDETVENIKDIAGIRVVCKYIDDIYEVVDILTSQPDIELVRTKDYVKNPKVSGYRSLHIIVKVPVFLVDATHVIPVEIQIRTIAMDTWASLEHELKYKYDGELPKSILDELKQCSLDMSGVDNRMQNIHNILETK